MFKNVSITVLCILPGNVVYLSLIIYLKFSRKDNIFLLIFFVVKRIQIELNINLRNKQIHRKVLKTK